MDVFQKERIMLRNIQIKTILIFTITGIILISALGATVILKMQKIEDAVFMRENIDSALILLVSEQTRQVKIISYVAVGVFGIISILVGIIISKVAFSPLSKLIDNAHKLIRGEKVDNTLLSTKKKKTEADELVDAFSNMTQELKDNLNEATRQKKQIETILLHMTDGIIAFNMEGEIIHKNPAAMNLLEITDQENTFKKVFRKINIEINMEKIIYLENWTSSEQRVSIGEKFINLFFAPFKDEKDRPAGVIVVIQDITEHVKLDNMRKEFVANVSHELKTPITSIMGYADTLLESDYEKELQDKFLNVIATEARRMASLVTDLLTLSKYDTNRVKTEVTEFDLGDLVKRCQEKLGIQIEQKHHNVECLVTANVPPVHADKAGMERVILNILSNSIKYTKEGGVIKIYVGFVYNDAYVKIIDNGIGIPEEDLSRIFERFYRVDKARTREMGGTGLGLSIAKEIMDKNGGSIDIKSVVDKGTEVVLRVPTKVKINV